MAQRMDEKWLCELGSIGMRKSSAPGTLETGNHLVRRARNCDARRKRTGCSAEQKW